MPQETGAHGWPLVPSLAFPGEKTLACPHCNSREVILTIRPGGTGTGPGGRWRMGDQGGTEIAACAVCHKASDGFDYILPEERPYIVHGGKDYRGWHVTFDSSRPRTGIWRAERYGVGMCNSSFSSLKRMIDQRYEEAR